jgi:hypothetical protein
MGVVCALRLRMPLVVAGMASHNPYAPWTASVVERHGDLSVAVVEAAASVVDVRDDDREIVHADGMPAGRRE